MIMAHSHIWEYWYYYGTIIIFVWSLWYWYVMTWWISVRFLDMDPSHRSQVITHAILGHVSAGDMWIVLSMWDMMDNVGPHGMWRILVIIQSWSCMIILDTCRSIHIGATLCISFFYVDLAIILCFGYLVWEACLSYLCFYTSMLYLLFLVILWCHAIVNYSG